MDRRAVGTAARRKVEKPGLNRARACPDGARGVPGQQAVTAFPKRHFPAIHRAGDNEIRAIFQSQ
jgi:hypothetical protein